MYNKKKYYLCIAFNKRHRLFAICLAELAQLVEQRIRNAWVGGSSPPFGSPPPFLRSSEVPILAAFLRPSFVLRLSAKHDGEAGDALRNGLSGKMLGVGNQI